MELVHSVGLSPRPRGVRTELARARAGQVSGVLLLLLVLCAGALLALRLVGDSQESGFNVIDPRRTRVDALTGFVDDRWRFDLAARLAQLPELSADDREDIDSVRAALAALPFVAEVGEGSVVWPDGYEIAVRFRKPVACVRTGAGFLAVAEDGVVLPGSWKRPPWVAGGWLPLLGPLEDPPRGEDAAARPGKKIAERRHEDALSVARSMRATLAAEDFQAMGAPVIDATHAPTASVEDPGVVLWLEEGRRVYFGRTPDCGEPGELPVAQKWSALLRALKTLRPTTVDARDWSLLDVRWDVPDVLWRDAPDAGAAPPPRVALPAAPPSAPRPPAAPPIAPRPSPEGHPFVR